MKVAITFLAFCATLALAGKDCKPPPPNASYATGIDGRPCPDFCRKCDTFGVGWTQCATIYDDNGCIMDKVCVQTGSGISNFKLIVHATETGSVHQHFSRVSQILFHVKVGQR